VIYLTTAAGPVPSSLLKELLNLRDTLANALEETKQTEALNSQVRFALACSTIQNCSPSSKYWKSFDLSYAAGKAV